MIKGKILFLVCPPFWEKLPPLGAVMLSEYLNKKDIPAYVIDINNYIYQKVDAFYKKDWTINREYTALSFFNYCFEHFHNIFMQIKDLIDHESIPFVGFTVLKGNRIFCIETALWLKKIFPNINIIFGGPEVFAMSLENFNGVNCADYSVVGEGEMALEMILMNKTVDKTISFQRADSIDFFPKYERFPLHCYPRKNALPILMSRGCINQCAFCSERLLYKGYRSRSVDSVYEEIEYHYYTNGIRWFTFYDSMINAHLKNLNDLLDLLLQKNLSISWDAQIGIRNDMDLDIMKKMKRAGCINVFIGMESGSDAMLKRMNKWFYAADAVHFFQRLNHAGLQFEISLIAHYPGEGDKEFQETINFLIDNKKLINKIAQISLFRNYPGTSVSMPLDYKETDGLKKIDKLVQIIKEQNIPFTPSFINNLI